MKNFFTTIYLVVLLTSFLVISCNKEEEKMKEPEKKEVVKEKEAEKDNSDQQGSTDGTQTGGTDTTSGGSTTDNTQGEGTDNNTGDNSQATDPKDNSEAMFVYKAYVEEITGTWCPNCPRVKKAIERAKQADVINKNFVAVALHYRDIMAFNTKTYDVLDYLKTIHDTLKFRGGVPWFRLNRERFLYASNATEHIHKYLKKKPHSTIGIKISSQLGQSQGKVSIGLKFKEDMTGLKYHVYILQDGINHEQNEGGRNRMQAHNGVLREVYGSASGNELGAVTKGQEIVKQDLQVNYELIKGGTLQNVRVVVFVSNDKNQVLNVQEAKANETKDYQYVN